VADEHLIMFTIRSDLFVFGCGQDKMTKQISNVVVVIQVQS